MYGTVWELYIISYDTVIRAKAVIQLIPLEQDMITNENKIPMFFLGFANFLPSSNTFAESPRHLKEDPLSKAT